MGDSTLPLLLASRHVSVIQQLKFLLKRWPHIDVLTLYNFSSHQESVAQEEELKLSGSEEAAASAIAGAEMSGQWTLAESTRFFVPSLDFSRTGKPYISSKGRESDCRKALLQKMKEMDNLQRTAYLECSLALAGPEGLLRCVTATCEGLVTKIERGNSDGYEAVFTKHDYDKTLAELSEQTRCRVSHRGKAFEKLAPTLESVLCQVELISRG